MTCFPCRRVVASCHLEMFPPEKGEEPVAHHMTAAREVTWQQVQQVQL